MGRNLRLSRGRPRVGHVASALAATAILAVIAAGCGGGGTSSGSDADTAASSTAAATTSEAAAEDTAADSTAESGTADTTASADSAISTLPAEIQPWYDGLTQNVGPSVYINWKSAQEPPWTIGYASTYAGNTWRAEVMKRVQELTEKYKAAGLVDKLIVTESNYDTAVQIQQMQQLIDQGADIIFTCCPTPTGLNKAIDAAYEKGVPFVSFDGDVTSVNGINTGVNFWLAGANEAEWLFDYIGGKGNVLNVTGIPGNNASDGFDKGVQNALQKYPDIKILDTIAGQWTDQVAKTEVLKWLATHPEKVDGVITQSAESTGVVQAFIQSGRGVPPMIIGDEAGAACYWRQNPDWIDKAFHVWPPGDEGQLAYEVMVRTLLGQGPKIASITRPQIDYDYAFVEANLPADCSLNSTDWIQPPAEEWMPSSTLDQFFENGYDPLEWKSQAGNG